MNAKSASEAIPGCKGSILLSDVCVAQHKSPAIDRRGQPTVGYMQSRLFAQVRSSASRQAADSTRAMTKTSRPPVCVLFIWSASPAAPVFASINQQFSAPDFLLLQDHLANALCACLGRKQAGNRRDALAQTSQMRPSMPTSPTLLVDHTFTVLPSPSTFDACKWKPPRSNVGRLARNSKCLMY